MDLSSLVGLLDELRLPSYPQEQQKYSTDIQGRPLDLSFMSGGYDPVYAPVDKLGMNPNDLSYAMMPYQGAPGEGDALSVLAQGGSLNNSSVEGFNFGGRVGTDLPISDQVRLALGLSGVSSDVTYGKGQSWGGRANRADVTGIDATLRDLANNREYGAEVKKDFSGNPFVSGFFRQRF